MCGLKIYGSRCIDILGASRVQACFIRVSGVARVVYAGKLAWGHKR